MLQFMGLQRVGQDLVTEQQQLACQRMCTSVNLIHSSQNDCLGDLWFSFPSTMRRESVSPGCDQQLAIKVVKTD